MAYQLELLARQGFSSIVICVGHLGEQIEAAFGNGQAFNVSIQYSYDGPSLVGTAGALRQALPKLGPSFLSLYGDSYLEVDYRAIYDAFEKGDKPALMTVIENSRGTEPSNVWFENHRIQAYDKKNPDPRMRHIDYGLGIYRSTVFQDVHSQVADLSALQSQLARENLLAGYEVTQPYFEIGSPSGLRALELHLQSKPILL